jgi:hypothetical protein
VAGPRVTAEPGVPEEIVAFLERTADLYASQDVAATVETTFNEDAVMADHRPLSGGVIEGWDALKGMLSHTFELLPDFAISIHVLAVADSGGFYLARDTYEGHATGGGGAAVMQWWVVDRLADGRLSREDIYETEHQARAAFEAATA